AARLAAEHGELLAAVAGDDVLAAHRGREAAGDRLEDEVAGRVAEGVVDLLEVIDVAEEQRQRRFVAHTVGKLGAETVAQVSAVVEAGEPVAHRALIELALVLLVEVVLVAELENHRAAELDLVAVAEAVVDDALPVHEGAVGGAEVVQPDLAPLAAGEDRMAPRDPLVFEAQVSLGGAAEHRLPF